MLISHIQEINMYVDISYTLFNAFIQENTHINTLCPRYNNHVRLISQLWRNNGRNNALKFKFRQFW